MNVTKNQLIRFIEMTFKDAHYIRKENSLYKLTLFHSVTFLTLMVQSEVLAFVDVHQNPCAMVVLDNRQVDLVEELDQADMHLVTLEERPANMDAGNSDLRRVVLANFCHLKAQQIDIF